MKIVKDEKFEQMFKKLENDSAYKAELDFLSVTEKIVGIMERKGISRSDLARNIGCTPAYVTKLLRGSVNFTMLTMRKLADALGCNIEYRISDCDQKQMSQERDWIGTNSECRKVVIGQHGFGILHGKGTCEWVEVECQQLKPATKRKEYCDDEFTSAA